MIFGQHQLKYQPRLLVSMVKEDGPWEPGDEIDWPYRANRYIKALSDTDANNRVLALSRISQEWLDEMIMMTMPFSNSEKAMMSFIANTLIEGDPKQSIKSMSCTIGDVQSAVASLIRSGVEYDLSSFIGTNSPAATLYVSFANQFNLDPRQPGLPLNQRTPVAAHVYKRLTDVEFEIANTSHSENVLNGGKPALPITNLDYKGASTDRATWFLGIFIHYTLLEREVMDSFLNTNMVQKRTLINRHFR